MRSSRFLLPALMMVAILAPAAPASAGFALNLVAGVDLGGTFDMGELDLDSDTGYNLAVEIMLEMPVIDVGIGAEYGPSRDASEGPGSVEYSMIYAISRLNLLGPVYLVGRLGYADASIDDLVGCELCHDNGWDNQSWGVGVGVGFIGKIKAEVLYSSLSVGGGSDDFDYQTYTARLMYTF